MISHAPICSVRTDLWWKLTAITALQMGHLILMIPSTAVGSASNNLLFLQHGQATCTSCIHFRLLYRGQPKGNVKLTVDYSFIFLCTYVRELVPKIAINKLYRTGVLASIIIYIYLRKHSNEVLFSFFQIKKQSKTEYQLRYFSVLLRLPTILCRS